MLLAAGQGTRLRPFTDTLPKPAIPFLTAPLICYSLELLDGIKVKNLVINTHHLPEVLRQTVKDIKPKASRVIFSDETDLLLGSAGGIHKAWPSLKGQGPILVMNADEVILPSAPYLLKEMLAVHKIHKPIATLLTMTHPEVGHQFGGAWVKDVANEPSSVVTFSKKSVGGLRGLHYLGVIILEERISQYFKTEIVEENILYETLATAMHAGEKVLAHEVSPQWFETGNPKDFLAATETCIAALSHPARRDENAPFWIQHLAQTMRWHSQNQIHIEKSVPGLAEKVLRVLDDVRES